MVEAGNVEGKEGTYGVIPVLDGIVCWALEGLDSGVCYEADEAFDC